MATSTPWKGSASLSVTAAGPELQYQWYLNGIAVSGATGSTYAIPSASASDSGNYFVRIKEAGGTTLASNTVALTLTGADGSGSEASGRVVVAPINSDTVRMPAWDKNWQVTYQFVTPALPVGQKWNPQLGVFYIWGDIDFDAYGANGSYKLSGYKYSQIVPQVMIGNVLSGNGTDYSPRWSSLSTWKIQAQYFWQKDNTPYAQTGALVSVQPGDVISETISYDAATGSITATISVPGGASTISIPRPFPNEPSLFANWTEFFKQAQAASGGAYVLAKPQLNVETYDVDKQTVCSVLPFQVKAVGIPGVADFAQRLQSGLPCAKPVQLDF